MVSKRARTEKVANDVRSINLQWKVLLARYLPVVVPDSIWRYSRGPLLGDQRQGWKLHVSATILTAARLLEIVGPLLWSKSVLFKAPSSLDELSKLNAGIYYGYSQIGKFLTVYPRSDREAAVLGRVMHRLTRDLDAPVVPFDLRYCAGSCVYYRYGAFSRHEQIGDNFTVLDPNGRPAPDVRSSPLQPEWAVNPFRKSRTLEQTRSKNIDQPTPLETTFKVFRALGQRGKGGVYHALDLSVQPARLCVVKEGRQNGETSWDGRDGFWRVQNEERVLPLLRSAGVDVPQVYSSFRTRNNFYVALELIDGENVENYLQRRQRRMKVQSALRLSVKVAQTVSAIHRAGWVWRDCKPRNVVLEKNGRLRPVDFEGACRIEDPDPSPWGTPGYVPPEWNAAFNAQSRLPEDLYALGVFIYILFTGRPPSSPFSSMSTLRKNVPEAVSLIVDELLQLEPRRRPLASTVARTVKAALDVLDAAKRNQRLDGYLGKPIRRERSAKRESKRRSAKIGSVVR
jgi:hypothetical protein